MWECTDKTHWNQYTAWSITKIIEKWKLPKSAIPIPKIKVKLAEELAKKPICVMVEKERGPRSLEVIVDCQPLAQIVNGDMKCGSSAAENVLSRTTDLVEQLIRDGREMEAKPIEWRPRHMNQMADHMVNQALDAKTSGEKWWGRKGEPPGMKGIPLTLFVDGGVRQNSRAGAAGWYLVGTVGPEVLEVACGSMYYGPMVLSSFMAEARALLAGLDAVKGLQSKDPGNWIKTKIPCVWETYRSIVRT